MSPFNFDSITAQFYAAGLKYSVAIQPYALKLFFALLLIDVIVTWLQYTMEGQLEPSHFLGRLIKHVLSGGFIYLMIVNGFTWMIAVIQSFSRIGAAISGLPALSPQTVLELGLKMGSAIFNAPANASLITNLELAIVQSVCGFFVLFAFALTAADLLLTLVKAYLTVGLGVILLSFGANRFTASASEGYFSHVIRIGVRLLFFYAVLAVGVQLANQWNAALMAACKPVPSTLPFWATYGVPPSSIVTTVCSGSLSASDMLGYAVLAVVFAIVTIAVPHMAADLVGGTVGPALAHAFEAAYIAKTIVRPITGTLQTGFNKITHADGGNASMNSHADSWFGMAGFRDSQRQSSGDAQPTVPLIDPNSGSHQAKVDRGTTMLQPGTSGFPAAKETAALAANNGNTMNIGNGASSTTPIGKPAKP
jgi:P-type conjugative transfer protein TrbL